MGSGEVRPGEPYRFARVPCRTRERFEKWPRMPVLRDEYCWEEAGFAAGLRRELRARTFDVTVACSYPFCNWALRRWGRAGGPGRPAHIFVTQNGDWPAVHRHREYRWFDCDALVCTNPEYYERNRGRWNCALIPNGVDPAVFCPGPPARREFGLPEGVPVVLMVSALIPSKRVSDGLMTAAGVPGLHVVVAGDGPERDRIDRLGEQLLPGRFRRVQVQRERMPALYRSVNALLHMSLDEPSSNAFIEALATGLPVVAHDRDVTRWTFEGTALLVDTRTPANVTRAIEQALREPPPSDLNARRQLVLRRYRWSAIADQYAQCLRSTAAIPAPR
jgi:glycosyltransferase involved in cell wall biosynthesis